MNMEIQMNEAEMEEATIAQLLADLSEPEEVVAVETEKVVEDPITGEVSEAALAELEQAVNKIEVYKAQSTEGEIGENIEATPKKEKKAHKTSGGTKKATTPHVTRVAWNDLPSTVLVRDLGTSYTDEEQAADTVKDIPTQKKIAEKYENLFVAVANGKSLSRYTEIAYRYLRDMKGSFSLGDLIAKYMQEGLGHGTAASQAGQIMVLFDRAHIAKRSGSILTRREDSAVAPKLDALLGIN